jgi:hypothetical protein
MALSTASDPRHKEHLVQTIWHQLFASASDASVQMQSISQWIFPFGAASPLKTCGLEWPILQTIAPDDPSK